MKRDLKALSDGLYDVLVVGGGIYGACIARDAALRGLSVALIEKEDFGHATSANSLKIIHGGLRYLQDGKPRLVRRMAREREAWLRTAPHLVHLLPCLMPTTRKVSRSRAVMSLALRLNDLLTYGRKRETGVQQHLPAGRVMDEEEAQLLLPDLPGNEITGAILWHDAQVSNTERLLLAIVSSAAAAGARVANYVCATGFLRDDQRISGVTAMDALRGQHLALHARLVVVAAGAWNGEVLQRLGLPQGSTVAVPSLAINLVTRRLRSDYAVAIPTELTADTQASPAAPRTLFIVPWGHGSLIGTLHMPWHHDAVGDVQVSDETVGSFVKLVNAAYPAARLSVQDVQHVHAGFLPAHEDGGALRLVRESRILDHEQRDGIAGVISVEGVKYTTARYTAQEAVDLALRKLQREGHPCVSHTVAVDGGDTGHFATFVQRAERAHADVPRDVLRHLVASYGTGYKRILRYAAEDSGWGQRVCTTVPVMAAEIAHAVSHEMAVRLSDVVRRRTPLGATGPPEQDCVQCCASIMTELLGWTAQQRDDEIEALYAGYGRRATHFQLGESA